LFELFKSQIEKHYVHTRKLRNAYNPDALDAFHANTIEIINKDIYKGQNKLFKEGDILFCIRNLNIIGVIDIEKEEIIWHWGANELDYPHHPSLLKNGNILIFDNGFHRGYSRVIELNPTTEKIEWEYRSNSPKFFTKSRGSAQKLPNDNVLITESDKGHVFEITRDGKIVWEFWNPDIKEGTKTQRATIYRMLRFTPEILNEISWNNETFEKLKSLKYIN